MFLQIAVASSFLFHVVLGGLCLMPMASAREMPMNYGGHWEMAMTPAVPMTPADCKGCMYATLSEPDPMQAMNCSDGHCFVQASNTVASVFSAEGEVSSALPVLQSHLSLNGMHQRKFSVSATVPPTAILTDNIVLLL